MTIVHHALLGLAIVALSGAAMRAVGSISPPGLERVVAAAPLAAAAAVAEAMLLGLVGLGASPVALSLATVGTWVAAALRFAPAADRIAWPAWGGLGRGSRVLAGGLAGAFAAWCAWLLAYPALGHDMVRYHLPEVVNWVHGGHPGSIERVVAALPVGSYPLTHEVLLGWSMAIARSFVPAALAPPAFVALLAASTWLGLRSLDVRAPQRGLACAALLSPPAIIGPFSGGATLDPAGLAWLACCGALCAASRRRTQLLISAIVAGGLAVGTKTTTVPLTLACLAAALWLQRERLRALAPGLTIAGAVAAIVGGFWYLRTTLQHGSPFWPYGSAPWGDPQPALIRMADVSVLDRPGATLSRLGSYYVDRFAAGIALIAGGIAAPLLRPARAVWLAALATLGSLLLWLNAPLTGVTGNGGFDVGTGDTTRYLLPGVGAGCLALALASRAPGLRGRLATAGLAAATFLGLWNVSMLSFPDVPSAVTPLTGAALGALAALVLAPRLPPLRLGTVVAQSIATVVAGVLSGAALGLAASGFVERHADTSPRAPGLLHWFGSQPRWREGGSEVTLTSSSFAPLAGDRLQNRLAVLANRAPCGRLSRQGAAAG